jgi:hypothetical protein
MKRTRVDAHLLGEADRSLGEAEANLVRAQDALRFAGALDAGAGTLPAMTPRVQSYREHLLALNGRNEPLADMNIVALLKQGTAMHVRQAELRVEFAQLERESSGHQEAGRRALAPLEAEVERLQNATTAAVTALDAARLAQEREFNSTFGARRAEIQRELSAPHSPAPNAEWRAWKQGDPPIAPTLRHESGGDGT